MSRGRHETPKPRDEGKSSRATSLEAAFVVTSSGEPSITQWSRRALSSWSEAVKGVLYTTARFTCSTGETMTPKLKLQP